MYGRHFLEISPIFFSSWRRERVNCGVVLEEDVCAVWTNNPFILGSVGLGEASDAMVELCLWAIYRIFT